MPPALSLSAARILRIANQAARSTGLTGAAAIPEAQRNAFVHEIVKANPGLHAAEVREALLRLWVQVNEDLGGGAKKLGAGGGYQGSRGHGPVDRGAGRFSPQGARLVSLVPVRIDIAKSVARLAPEELAGALAQALKAMPRRDAFLFLDRFSLEDLDKAGPGRGAISTDGVKDTLRRSATQPAYHPLSTQGDGFVVFKGSVFPDGHFRKLRANAGGTAVALGEDPAKAEASAPSTRELAARQPWLQWDAVTGKFDVRATGAQEAYLKGLPHAVTLHRGTRPEEAGFVAALRELWEPPAGKADLPKVAADLRAGFTALLRDGAALPAGAAALLDEVASGRHGAELPERLVAAYAGCDAADGEDSSFWTTSESTARKWASPHVLTTTVSRDELLQMSARADVYVGFEYGADEFGVAGGANLARLFREASSSVVAKAPLPDPAGWGTAGPIDNPDD